MVGHDLSHLDSYNTKIQPHYYPKVIDAQDGTKISLA